MLYKNKFAKELATLTNLVFEEYEGKISDRGHSWEANFQPIDFMDWATGHLEAAIDADEGGLPSWISRKNIIQAVVYLNMALARLEE